MTTTMTIKVSDIRGALKKASAIVKPKGVSETARFVAFDPEKGAIWADDGSTTVVVKIPQIKRDGTEPFALDGSKLSQVVAGFDPDKEIRISLKEAKAEISCGRSRFTIARLASEKMPAPRKLGDYSAFTFRREILTTALSDTLPFVAGREETMAILSGLHVEASEQAVKLTATNRHTLSHVQVKPARANGEQRSMTLKAESVKAALNVLDGEWYHLLMGDDRWAINDGTTTVIGGSISGQFPDYTRIIKGIDQQKSEQVVVSVETLKKSIVRLKGFSDNGVVIEEREGLLTFTARSGGEVSGEDVIEVPVKLMSPVGVNIRYLDALASTFHGEQMTLTLPQDGKGVLSTRESVSDMEKVQVVSPIRI